MLYHIREYDIPYKQQRWGQLQSAQWTYKNVEKINFHDFHVLSLK